MRRNPKNTIDVAARLLSKEPRQFVAGEGGERAATPFTARRKPSDAGVTLPITLAGMSLLTERGDEAFCVLRR